MKVLLIDDHPLILSALKSVMESLGEHVAVKGVASARAARKALADDAGYDLVMLDLRLGDADGFDVLKELRAGWPAMPVVVISASDRPADIVRAIDLGAMGYVPKNADNAVLFEALRVVMSGGLYVPTMAAPSFAAGAGGPSPGEGYAAPVPADLSAFKLTPRQTDVLALLLRGQSNKLIARELKLSVETVKDHVAAVLRTLGVSSRTQAVLAVGQMSSQGRVAPWLTRPRG